MSGAKGRSERLAWYCYFLLGAGFLAPWNAFISATDYFTFVFPSVHVDRLFTVSYLPSCLLLLLWCVLDTTHSDRWLGAAATRITSCFVAFTFILLLTPLVDGLGLLWGAESATQGALVMLMLTVVIVGALDGACQGAIFSEAAVHGSQYTQAVAAGTACSGLLVSLLRCMCKAAWSVADEDGTPAAAALRASTALYFALGAALTAACVFTHKSVLPRLLLPPSHPHTHSHTHSHHHHHHLSDNGHAHTQDMNSSPRSLAGSSTHTGSLVRDGSTTQLELPGWSESGAADGTTDAAHASAGPGGGGVGVGVGEATPLLAARGAGAGGTVVRERSPKRGARAAAGGKDSRNADGDGLGRVVAGEGPTGLYRDNNANNAGDTADDVLTLGALLGGHGDTTSHTHTSRDMWQREASEQLLHAYHRQSAPGAHDDTHAAPHTHAAGPHSAARQRAELRAAWQNMRPYCLSLIVTYSVTLCIFPGFLAEDVHSSELGEWYAILVITCYNAADMIGKLIPPGPLLSKHEHTPHMAHHTRGSALRRFAHVLLTPVWLSCIRGVCLLATFLWAAMAQAPAWVIFTATAMLGLSNGWLTVIAMAAAPSLLPEHLTVQGEGLLVIALVAGLLAGALLGWLWLIPGGF